MARSRKGLKGVVHSRQVEADQDMVNSSRSTERLRENAIAFIALSETPFLYLPQLLLISDKLQASTSAAISTALARGKHADSSSPTSIQS